MALKLLNLIISLILCLNSFGQNSRQGENAILKPNIRLVSFNELKLNKLNKDSLENWKIPIVIFFWMHSCKPWIRELNIINKLVDSQKINDKIRMLAVSTDKPENYERAKQLAINNGWKYEMYFDIGCELRNSLLNNWFGLPQLMIIDEEKIISLHKLGYRPGDEEEIVKIIIEMIKK